MRRLRLDPFRLGLGVGLAFAVLHLASALRLAGGGAVPVVSRLEAAAQDWTLARLRGPRAPSGDVVIVAIDERALREEGAWPWSRARLARLVDALAAAGARAVGFDVVFGDEDVQGRRLARVAALVEAARAGVEGPSAERLALAAAAAREEGAAPGEDPTARLAGAVERAGNVTVGFVLLAGSGARAAVDDPAAAAAGVDALRFFRAAPPAAVGGGALAPGAGERGVGPVFEGALPPVPELVAVADSGGFLNVLPDPDGVIRRYPAVAQAGGATFPSLGVALLSRPAPAVPVVAAGDGRLLEVRAGGIAVPTDGRGLAGLAWHGPSSAFPSVSAADVLGGRVAPGRLRGKVVLVGPTAPGTWDQRVTPFDEAAPGVLVHATFVENALRGELLDRSPAVLLAELALMVALAAGLAALFARVRPAAALPALLAVAAAWAGAAAWALEVPRVALAVGLPVAQALAVFLAVTTARVLREEREKRRARETFGRFLAPAVVEEVLSREGGLAPGGEKRDLTVLFADVRGFTSLSERLDPAALLALLNEVLAPMTEVVVAGHEGTLDKYMGDALMAFWGAPRHQPDHALRACRAALGLAARLAAVREDLRARGLPEIDVGVGINTGAMSVGFVGSQDRFYNYTVLGDAVNLASRLEGANREYGTRILLGPETHARVREEVVARELDLVRVKGRREPVAVHELLGLAPAAAAEAAFLEAWARGRAAFRARRWEEAEAWFREADALRGGDPPSRLHLARCEALRRAPPGPEWDGVHELAAK